MWSLCVRTIDLGSGSRNMYSGPFFEHKPMKKEDDAKKKTRKTFSKQTKKMFNSMKKGFDDDNMKKKMMDDMKKMMMDDMKKKMMDEMKKKMMDDKKMKDKMKDMAKMMGSGGKQTRS